MKPHLILFLMLGLVCAESNAAETRIAIVSREAECGAASDLLTVAFTKGATNLALVERTEIDKVFGEQSLRKDFRSAGQTLHAHGLLLIELLRSPRATNVAVRLVGVNTGVILDASIYRWPLEQGNEWAQFVTRRLLPFMPKLVVAREQTTRISMLNFRAPVSTASAVRTERLVTSLLFHRLAANDEVFVLERREMGKLDWEKALRRDEDQSFWNGSYLLEGMIDPEGSNGETITVQAKLSPPDQKAATTFAISVPRQNAGMLIEKLSAKILDSIQHGKAPPNWDTIEEARQFEQEAGWSMTWGLWREGASAAESSWALGRHTEGIAAINVRALLEQARPRLNAYENSMRWVYDSIRHLWVNTIEPESAALPTLVEAMELYLTRTRSEASFQTNSDWVKVGFEVLDFSSGTLIDHYAYGIHDDTFDDQLVQIRALAREIHQALSPVADKNQWEQRAMRHAFLWQDKAEQTIGHYRQMLQTGIYARHRVDVLRREVIHDLMLPVEFKMPLWIAWSKSDREHGAQAWNAFVSELINSTNRSTKAEGLLLAMRDARVDQQLADASESFLDVVMDEGRQRFQTNIDYSLIDTFDDLLVLRQEEVHTLRRGRLLAAWKAHEFARMKHYLQTAERDPSDRVSSAFEKYPYSVDQARELLPVLEEYSNRFPKSDIEVLLTNIKAKTKATSAPSASPQSASGIPQVIPPNPRGEMLQITNVFKAEIIEALTKRSFPAFFQNAIFREGALFASIPYPDTLPTFEWKTWRIVWLDTASHSMRSVCEIQSTRERKVLSFEVLKNEVYWLDEGGVLHARNRDTQMQHGFNLDLPSPGEAQLQVIGSRLFICSSSFIAEFARDTGSAKILASSRRRPAVNDLDRWGWIGTPQLKCADNDTLSAVFQGGASVVVWQRTATSGNWTQLPAVTFSPFATVAANGEHILASSQDFKQRLDQTIDNSGRLQTLLSADIALMPMWPLPLDYSLPPPSSGANVDAAWRSFDGTNLWILQPPFSGYLRTAATEQVDRHGTLFWFDPQYELPCVIPFSYGKMDRLPQPGYFAGLRIQVMEPGLLLLPLQEARHVWLITWSELEQWRKRNRPATRNIPRTIDDPRLAFDADHNGVLDAHEKEVMTSNKEWQQATNNLQAKRLFLTFDEDGNDQLDSNEIKTLLTNARIRLNAAKTPAQAGDTMDLKTFTTSYQDGLLAAKAASGSLAGRLGPGLGMTQVPQGIREFNKQFDKNKNGRLEKEEVQELNRVMATFDKNGTGHLEPDELNEMKRSLGMPVGSR